MKIPFWENTIRQGDCLVWTGRIDRDGYGGYGSMPAHRYAYIDKVGEITKGLEIDHLCRNRACVNPAHLEAVTHKENTLRGNTITARNKAVTHCPLNHEYNSLNTYISPRGGRHCRKCQVMAVQRYRKRSKQL